MRRYDPTDLTPKISLSVDESWYEKYWLTDRPDPALARPRHKLRTVLASHAAIRARLWPTKAREPPSSTIRQEMRSLPR
jgi:hypothetical protein